MYCLYVHSILQLWALRNKKNFGGHFDSSDGSCLAEIIKVLISRKPSKCDPESLAASFVWLCGKNGEKENKIN
jgi:hypothetical protein